MLFVFRQNNSGGFHVINENVTRYVAIKATSEKKAFKKAKEVGIYFDGCDKGIDCSCCGDRWRSFDVYDGLYDLIVNLWTLFYYSAWLEDDQPALIVYKEEKEIYTLAEIRDLFVKYVPNLIQHLQTSLDNIANKTYE